MMESMRPVLSQGHKTRSDIVAVRRVFTYNIASGTSLLRLVRGCVIGVLRPVF